MRILYKYLTTSLFPRHIEPEVRAGHWAPSLPATPCLCVYVCCMYYVWTHTRAGGLGAWGRRVEQRGGRWDSSDLDVTLLV